MLQIDANSEFGAQVARRLASEPIIWLTTVGADLTPQPVPVWFWWDGQTAPIYSKPGTPKLRNIARSPRGPALQQQRRWRRYCGVCRHGPDRAGRAGAERGGRVHREIRRAIARMGQTTAYFAQEYSVAIHVTPTGLRGF
ncbi:MAG: pyridoxamine 5'-phosphate oxidase family protein [Kouleothrix sp.]